jgi:hypothetical protein
LYSALFGVYTEVLHELKGVLQGNVTTREAANYTNQPEPATNDEFREQRRRKRNSSDGQVKTAKKAHPPTTSANDPRLRRQQEVPTRNFFAPLRSSQMETGEEIAIEHSENQQAASSQMGRPPPIVQTSEVNLIALQRQLKTISSSFEFRSTRKGTKVVTKEMADFSAIRAHFESQNFPHYTFTLNP